jgi:hypothetical protein
MSDKVGETCVYVGDEICIYWNGSATYNIYRDNENIDCFTSYEAKNSSDAIWVARNWVEDQERKENFNNANS